MRPPGWGRSRLQRKSLHKKGGGPCWAPVACGPVVGTPHRAGRGGVVEVVVRGEWPSDVHVVIVLICLALQRGLLARCLQDLQGRLAQALLPHVGSRLGRQDG